MKHVNQSLPDYIADALSDVERQTIEEHLAKCPACSAEYKEMQQTFAFLRQGQLHGPDQSYFNNLLPMIRQHQEHTVSWHSISGKAMRWALPLSAATVIAMFVLLLPSRMNPSINASGLQAILSNSPTDELADVAVEQDKISLVAVNHECTSTMIDEHLNRDRIMKEALFTDNGTEVFSNMELENVVEEFDSDQVDHLLGQLKERKSL